jgi:vacuolar protein sorting-associated protein 41
LIIDRLADVSQAIAFAKQQDEPDLWEDLLNYSMDKPRFIRGLLEEVGTTINPITLVRRIPEGLEIEGLREGLSRMVKEYEIQFSISSGVARVLRGEVATAQMTLRSGQRKGIRFDVYKPHDITTSSEDIKLTPANSSSAHPQNSNVLPQPGHCVGCHEPFSENEKETLVGFACGDVFHLTHLLAYSNRSRPPTPLDVDLDEDRDLSTHTHSIGSKVTHARILRDMICGGCPACSR